jgi:hypothetical protein
MTATVLSLDTWRAYRMIMPLEAESERVKKPAPKPKAKRKKAQVETGYLLVDAGETIRLGYEILNTLPLNGTETNFITDMAVKAGRYGEAFGMTERQLTWFRSLAARLELQFGGAA